MATAPPLPLDLASPEIRDDPYPVYRWYREHRPVYPLAPQDEGGITRWMLTRMEDVRQFLRHPALRRQVHRGSFWNRPLDSVPPESRAFAAVARKWPLFLDPPDHAAPRRAINRALGDSFLAHAEESVTRTASELCAALPGRGEADVVRDFAALLPLELNRRWLGIDGLSAAELQPGARAIVCALGTHHDAGAHCAAARAVEQILPELESAADRVRRGGAPDAHLLAGLVRSADHDGLIPTTSVAPLALLLLLTALDTTVNLVANGILTFLRHRDQIAPFLDLPAGDTRAASEVARFESPVQQVTRHADAPLEIRGETIAPGEGVSFLLGAANRDPAAYPGQDPDSFDITREPGEAATFGAGVHQCPGADLGLREATAAWRAFFGRFPDARLAGRPVRWLPLVTFRGPQELPVELG